MPMKIDKRFCDLAVSLAKTSKHQIRVGAVLLSGREIISVGVNSISKSHPMQKYYNDLYRGFTVPIHNNIHAELDAILKYRRMRIELPKLKIVIARLNKSGELLAGRPCPACYAAIIDNNIDSIIYSTETQFIYDRI